MMVSTQTRKRLRRQLGDKADVFERIGQTAYNEGVGSIAKVLAELARKSKDELVTGLRNEYGNQGLASAKPCVGDWMVGVVEDIFNDGYEPIIEAVRNSIADPNDIEEVNAMNRSKNLLAVACEAHKRGEKELAGQIFAEAMDQADVADMITETGLEIPKADPVAEDGACDACGTSVTAGSKFCNQCGKEITAAAKKPEETVADVVVTPEARRKIVAIANEIASKDDGKGKYKAIARKLLAATRPE